MDDGTQDICRVCRSEGSPDRPLFYPCVCTGSIKYIHQDCLVQWLRYSRKEYCELCNHRFSFTPIYAPDMPKRLPFKDIVSGLFSSVATAVRFWLHYTVVAFAWLGVVPISACRIHRSLFNGSLNSILALPLDLISSGEHYYSENILSDIFHGCIVVMCTLCVFISLVWLREHIMHGGGPDWLDAQAGEHHDPGEEEEDDDDDDDNGIAHAAEPIGFDGDGNNNARGNNDDANWNPIEWDRAAEELTWERLLGLDGSLVFMEHVFWVVSLNTLFILVFEFCPYHIGNFTVIGLQLKEYTEVPHFEGGIITLCGYCVIGICLVLLHAVASLFRLRKSKKILGLCYVVVKVCLLSVVEIGLFPLVCGWWLDVCSLSLFDATLKDREMTFAKAPGTTMFMHWLFGMIYVFYFASFILMLREVLRPGVLWFLRNLNDPDFNPIQEMIHLPVLRHIRRFLFSMIIFGTTVLLMVWLPIRIIKRVWPSFLPYTFVFTTEQAHELSLELVLLQVMMPALLEQGHSREWLKSIVKGWCIVMAWFLDLRSYLLGDVPLDDQNKDEVIHGEDEVRRNDNVAAVIPPEIDNENNANVAVERNDLEPPVVDVAAPAAVPAAAAAPVDAGAVGGLGFVIAGNQGGLGAAHHALLLRDGPTGFHPYRRPKYFFVKMFILLVTMCATLTVVSIGILTVPVSIGRFVMSYWLSNSEEPVHELYTTASGLYVSWLSIRLMILGATWLPRGWAALLSTARRWSVTILKALVAIVLLVGIIPFMCGILFELVLISPMRVPLNQTPLFTWSENWVMGTLYIKIGCASTMMTPQNFWLRRAIERIYNDGLRNINLNFIITELAAPCIVWLGMALAIPYCISQTIVPIFVSNLETQNMIERRIYPFLLVVVVILGIVTFQIRQFRKLYEHIKNDKYLVGRRLVNYERPSPGATMILSSHPMQPPVAP